MRVAIGKYKNWVGPYQIADTLQKIGVSEETCDKIGEKLANTKLMTLCEWVHNKRKRKVKIKLDGYDLWNLDHTLSLIIHPALVELKKIKHGYAIVDNEDVPENLRVEKTENNENETVEMWDWVLDEMIFSFEFIIKNQEEYTQETYNRVQNGLRLFGKYYLALWD